MGLPPTKEKKLKPQNMGPTPLSLVIFQCGIVSHKRKKNPKPQNLGSTATHHQNFLMAMFAFFSFMLSFITIDLFFKLYG